ncbi:DUF3801 domain-containing protein [Eubacteriales bacterium OttesenSCG-928-N14]|nr:DUF3801 domain-containing protein [Eubacteriales bacterium OttesenSCG-928-N14]
MNSTLSGAEIGEQVTSMGIRTAANLAKNTTRSGTQHLSTFLMAYYKKQKQVKQEKDNQLHGGEHDLEYFIERDIPMTLFSIRESDLAAFAKEAEAYDLAYYICMDMDANDGMCDCLCPEVHSSRMDRIIERFAFETMSKDEVDTDNPMQAANERSLSKPYSDRTTIAADEYRRSVKERLAEIAGKKTGKEQKSLMSQLKELRSEKGKEE